jgi:dTDP-4-amino-4,6-dideoxygalactose transaminase
LYSLHKMFPMSTGGMAVYDDPDLVVTQTTTQPDLAAMLLGYDWSAIAARRKANYGYLDARLRPLASSNAARLELLWDALGPQDVPQTMPVLLSDRDSRDHAYHEMNADGFGVVSLYHTLIPQCDGLFPALDALSQRILNLPVHQDASEPQLAALADRLVELVG